ncbi:cytochrome P450 736A117-like [Silene latifolia]|uniref:cytochrome P450 736A117-like n=1 Tax=Silene latifolia TaxID=37657 RepID=UPI003D77B84F
MSNILHQISSQPLLLLPFILTSIILYKWFYPNHHTKPKNTPPSPPKLPILGNLHQLGLHPHHTLHSLSKQYGDLMLLQLGQKPTLIVSSSKMAKQIMKTHDSISSNRPKSRVFDKLLYGSRDVASAPYGEYWRQMKSIFVLQLLSTKRVRSFRGIRDEESDNLVEKIKENVSLEVNLSEMFIRLTNDVVCRAAFGRKYSGNEESCERGAGFEEVLKGFVELVGMFDVGDFIPWMSWVNRVNGLNKRMDNVAKKFDMILEEIICEHLNRKLDGSEGENHTKDFVDVLLDVQREDLAGFPIEKDSIKALLLLTVFLVQDAFAGGTDTTYTVLEWAMSEFLRHPKVMKTLQEEVRGIVKGKEYISEDYLDQMKYLKAVMKETLRLHPPVPLLFPRETEKELELNGYQIPAKTLVIINASAIQRDTAIWEEPDEFRPERFLSCAIDFKGHDFELIPFGGGRRVCPGISFAMANNEIVIAKLVNKYNWSLPHGIDCDSLDMSECTGLTIHRKIPLLAVATPYF